MKNKYNFDYNVSYKSIFIFIIFDKLRKLNLINQKSRTSLKHLLKITRLKVHNPVKVNFRSIRKRRIQEKKESLPGKHNFCNNIFVHENPINGDFYYYWILTVV